MADHVLGHGRLRDTDAKHLKFPMHARCAPERILPRQPTNDRTDLSRDRWSTARASRLPCPVEAKSIAVPADQRIGLEDRECFETARPEAVEPDPKQPFTPTKPDPFRCGVVHHGELLAKGRGFRGGVGRGFGIAHPVQPGGGTMIVFIPVTLRRVSKKSQRIQKVRGF